MAGMIPDCRGQARCVNGRIGTMCPYVIKAHSRKVHVNSGNFNRSLSKPTKLSLPQHPVSLKIRKYSYDLVTSKQSNKVGPR